MERKKFRLLLVCLLTAMMTGCFRMRVMIDVNKDGTATQGMDILMMESMLTMDGSSADTALEGMKEQYQEEFPDATVEVVREGEGDNAFAGVRIRGIEADEQTFTITKEGRKITLELPLGGMQDELSDSAGISDMGLSLSSLAEYGAEASVIVNMPAKPETNLGTVEGNSVTVDLLAEETGGTLVVTCTTGSDTAMIIGIIVVLGIAIGAAAYFLSRKKETAQ